MPVRSSSRRFARRWVSAACARCARRGATSSLERGPKTPGWFLWERRRVPTRMSRACRSWAVPASCSTACLRRPRSCPARTSTSPTSSSVARRATATPGLTRSSFARPTCASRFAASGPTSSCRWATRRRALSCAPRRASRTCAARCSRQAISTCCPRSTRRPCCATRSRWRRLRPTLGSWARLCAAK